MHYSSTYSTGPGALLIASRDGNLTQKGRRQEQYGSPKNWNFWLITNLMLIMKIVMCIDNLI